MYFEFNYDFFTLQNFREVILQTVQYTYNTNWIKHGLAKCGHLTTNTSYIPHINRPFDYYMHLKQCFKSYL